ncbi:MAG TPA: hypothetical protein VG737_08970 [Cyclobacteriaceae bacterium]|nr:hypothetical protein [Cyclobacteriaceae bacterium]
MSTAILFAGLLAGTCDITAACIQFYLKTGKGPAVIGQYIASAVFGTETAYSGDVSMIIIGFVFHYMVAFGWTILFFFAYPRLSFLRGNKIIVGIAYGAFVWLMMNQVVVPLTLIGRGPFNLVNAAQAMAILMACIGIPISLVANSYYRNK